MRRFNSSHVAVALASLLCITAYSLSLFLHPAQAQESEEESVRHVLQGVQADESEPPDEIDAIDEGQQWRHACSHEDVQAVHDYFNPVDRQTIVSLCDARPRALNMPSPQYPKLAQMAHVSGEVVVKILIDETGRVIYSDALSGHPLLTPAAIKTACQVRFEPLTLSGIPYKTSGTITYNFIYK
jgi:TonB family C-terminal domain